MKTEKTRWREITNNHWRRLLSWWGDNSLKTIKIFCLKKKKSSCLTSVLDYQCYTVSVDFIYLFYETHREHREVNVTCVTQSWWTFHLTNVTFGETTTLSIVMLGIFSIFGNLFHNLANKKNSGRCEILLETDHRVLKHHTVRTDRDLYLTYIWVEIRGGHYNFLSHLNSNYCITQPIYLLQYHH